MSYIERFGVHSHYTYNIPVPERPDSTDAAEYGEGSQSYKPVAQSFCFGLPYQDHNYGAPPPPTPPPSPPPPNRLNGINGHIDIEDVSCNTTVVTSSQQNANQEDSTGLPDSEAPVDDSITRCICDYIHDDGYMICCDRCSVWQHVDCMGVDRNNIPDIYYCERCEPRKLNKQRAVQLQTRKREILMIDTSATESENETKQFASKPKVARKKKFEKRENNNKLVNGKKKTKKIKIEKDARKKTGLKKSPQLQIPQPLFDIKKSPVKNKVKSIKSPVISGEETNVMPWRSEQYADTYEEAPGNHYSPGLQELLLSRKLNGQQPNYMLPSKPPIQLRAQLCRVSQFGDNHRGLEAVENLSPVEPLIEYKGNVMLRDQYSKENRFFQSFQPHVLFYPRIDHLDLCIDASTYGNDARHVRRSCCPNAEMKHFLDGNQIYFYIYTTKSIAKGSEITIPFDFNYQECNYGVDCACEKPSCMVVRYHRGITNNSEEIPLQVLTKAAKKQKKMPKSLEEPLHIDITPPPLEIQPPVVSPPLKRRRVSSQSISGKQEKSTPVTPVKTPPCLTSPKSPGLASPTMSGSSDHEGDDERFKKMSREDRKLAAIMKAFEKMEKRAERRKDALARIESEKSQESESDSKPCKQETKPKQKTTRTKSINKQEDIPPTPILVKGKDKKPKTKERKSSEKKEVQEEEPAELEDKVEPEMLVSVSTPVKNETLVTEESDKSNEDTHQLEETVEPKLEVTAAVIKKEEPEQEIDDDPCESKSVPKLEENVEITSPIKEEIIFKPAEKELVKPLNEDYNSEVPLMREDKPERPTRHSRKKRRGGGTPARRRTRVSSSISTTTNDSAEESSNSVPPTPTTSTPVSHYADYLQGNSSTPLGEKTFKLPKTKKHLMNEWLNEKNSEHSSPNRPLEINTLLPEEAEADFVKCVPSPHTNSFNYMRRSSVSSTASNHTKAVDSIPGVQLDTSMGSAKKRWLRQAMFERSSSTPVEKSINSGNTSPVVCSSATSPATSPPVDFVTPLKKRRLARESLSNESPYVATPSTPTHISESLHNMSPTRLDPTDIVATESNEKWEGQANAVTDPNRNGICHHSFTPGKSDSNIFDKLSLSKIDEESSPEKKRERTLSSVLEDKLSTSNINTESEKTKDYKYKMEEENDLRIGCSQGFEYNVYEKETPCSSETQSTLLSSKKLLETYSEEPSTSQKISFLNSSQSEASYSSSKLSYFSSDPDVSHGDSCSYINKTNVQSDHFFHDQQTEEKIDSSCVVNEKNMLNVSQDSGLISDQEKTCSSSCSDSASQELMSSSFESIHSVRNKVESSQTFSVSTKQILTESNECETSDCEKVLNYNNSERNLPFSDAIATNYSATADSSKDNIPSIEGGLDCSFEIGSSSSTNRNKCMMVSSETIETTLHSSSAVGTSVSDQIIKPVLGEDGVSCSWESCTAEAEAKVCPSSNEITRTAEVSDLEDGELPPHSTCFKIESSAVIEESEKEEGEITDDDDEEDIVDSSSVVNDDVVNSVNNPPNQEDEMESNEVENTDNLDSLCSNSKEPVESSMPSAYRLDSSSQNEVVSSSRSTSPYWDNSLYRKRGWWRQEKEATATVTNSTESHNSSPTTANNVNSPHSQTRDSKSHEIEDQYVDSTSERDRISVRHSTSIHHSPIVSSSEWNCSVQRDRSISLDSTGGLSPASAADSITSPTSANNQPPGKKKVSLLEYRKRMKQRSQDSGTSSSSVSRIKSSSRSTPSTPLYPTLPLFPKLSSAHKDQEKKSSGDPIEGPTSGLQGKEKKRKDDEVKWSAAATMAERIREQTQLTLTERLRREFGLDTMDESEDNQDEESDDEPPPPPPPPPPPATTSTVTLRPQVRVVTATYHHPQQNHLLSNQPGQILQPGGQIVQAASNAATVLIAAAAPHQTQGGAQIMTAPPSVTTQIIGAPPGIQSHIMAPQQQSQLVATNRTEIVTSTSMGDVIGHTTQQCMAATPTQLYTPHQNIYSTMQTSGVDHLIHYTAQQQQSSFTTINQLTSVPPPPLPLEPQVTSGTTHHHHPAPQLPLGPQPPAPELPAPTAPQLPMGPQPPAPELPQPPLPVAPQGALLPTPGCKPPLLPTPHTMAHLPPPPLPPTPLPSLSHQHTLATHSLIQSSLPSSSTGPLLPTPQLQQPNMLPAPSQQPPSMLQTSSAPCVLNQPVTVTSALHQPNCSSEGMVPSLLSIHMMPTKVFNRSLMEENNQQSGVQPGPNGSNSQNYSNIAQPSPQLVDPASTAAVVSSNTVNSTQQLFPPPPQPPVLVNYNHGYPAASAFQQ